MSESATVEYTLLIRNMPANERPRERLQYYGAGALASAELIAILLRVGTEGESVLHVAPVSYTHLTLPTSDLV